MENKKEEIIKEFREKFVKSHYPFLGGQHDIFKRPDIEDSLWEMELIGQIEEFISQALLSQRQEIVRICNQELQKDWQGKKENKIYNQALEDIIKIIEEV